MGPGPLATAAVRLRRNKFIDSVSRCSVLDADADVNDDSRFREPFLLVNNGDMTTRASGRWRMARRSATTTI